MLAYFKCLVSYFKYSLISVVLLAHMLLSAQSAEAAEGGASFYVPGLYGDTAIAVAPPAGIYLLSTTIHYQSEAANSLLPGQIDNNIEATTIAQLLRGFWVSDEKFLGATMMMAMRVAAFDIDVSADIQTQFGALQLDEKNRDYGDLAVIPLSLFWKLGDIHLNLYEVVSIPISKYTLNSFTNTGLNHWAFDTVLSASWFDPKTGIEISLAPGLIYNTKNPDTNYKSGTEFHVDVMFNLHLSKELTVGLHGSYYKQLTADKGAHPSLGSFKGRSYSIGPAIVWHKVVGQQQYYLSAKWLHEFEAENKVEGDLTIFTMGMKF